MLFLLLLGFGFSVTLISYSGFNHINIVNIKTVIYYAYKMLLAMLPWV